MQKQKLVNSYICWLYTFAEKSNATIYYYSLTLFFSPRFRLLFKMHYE